MATAVNSNGFQARDIYLLFHPSISSSYLVHTSGEASTQKFLVITSTDTRLLEGDPLKSMYDSFFV